MRKEKLDARPINMKPTIHLTSGSEGILIKIDTNSAFKTKHNPHCPLIKIVYLKVYGNDFKFRF